MTSELEARLEKSTQRILSSRATHKLIVAGPGAGKTFTFGKLLDEYVCSPDNALVLTFINNLKDELERDLGSQAGVFTFHGYCLKLLHEISGLRSGLSAQFEYFPPVTSLIKKDWIAIHGNPSPKFIGLIRKLDSNDEVEFYLARSNYYDAVSFDDSVYRVYQGLAQDKDSVPTYKLILVDEYQDFNRLESSFIELMAERSSIVVAGDDDQALYVQLRGSSPDFIRSIHNSGTYEIHGLPFSMRCTEAVVNAVHAVLQQAEARGLMLGRINKAYEYYPPRKGIDSAKYPRLKVVCCSVQRKSINYFGQYIEQEIKKIPSDEIIDSIDHHYPTVLVIGPSQYTRQIQEYLESAGVACDSRTDSNTDELDRSFALTRIGLKKKDNLGWRLVLEIDQPAFLKSVLKKSASSSSLLHDLVPNEYRDSIMQEVADLPTTADAAELVVAETISQEQESDELQPSVRLTSFEGSKGLSAQHVFIVGLHNGDLPNKAGAISDLEVCKFLVALTRTRKQCHLLHTLHWGAQRKNKSVFVTWVEADAESIYSDKKYFAG